MMASMITPAAMSAVLSGLRSVVVRLFVNDGSDAFVEPTGGGYAPRAVTGKVDGMAVVYPPVRFQFTQPIGKVFGYFLTLPDGTVLGSSRFEHAPFLITHGGDSIEITPRVETMPDEGMVH